MLHLAMHMPDRTCSSLGSLARTCASIPVYFGGGPPAAIPRLGAAEPAARDTAALAGVAFDRARAASILSVGM